MERAKGSVWAMSKFIVATNYHEGGDRSRLQVRGSLLERKTVPNVDHDADWASMLRFINT